MTAQDDRVSLYLEGTAPDRRTILSPEGVPLAVELADHGERATALAIDLFIWLAVTLGVSIPIFLIVAGGFHDVQLAIATMLFVGFFIRTFYFLHFELAWRGSTPGKHIIGLRVIDRKGGPLRPSAVIARNLTREIETFLPLGILLSKQATASSWEQVTLGLWLLGIAALPLFNRDHLRGGDLIAGTMVIALPRRLLLRDLVAGQLHFTFTGPQLLAYGAFELQILEELLRRPEGPDTIRLRREVCDKIRRKIGWEEEIADAAVDRFLRDFYTAERAHLEREQLFGRKRADKHEASG